MTTVLGATLMTNTNVCYWDGKNRILIFRDNTDPSKGRSILEIAGPLLFEANVALSYNSIRHSFLMVKNRGTGFVSAEEAQHFLKSVFNLDTKAYGCRATLTHPLIAKDLFLLKLKYGLDLSY